MEPEYVEYAIDTRLSFELTRKIDIPVIKGETTASAMKRAFKAYTLPDNPDLGNGFELASQKYSIDKSGFKSDGSSWGGEVKAHIVLTGQYPVSAERGYAVEVAEYEIHEEGGEVVHSFYHDAAKYDGFGHRGPRPADWHFDGESDFKFGKVIEKKSDLEAKPAEPKAPGMSM